MVSALEMAKRRARGASGTGSPQLYVIGIISAIVALLVFYEIIRTIRITGSTWKNLTSRFRILILSSCFLELALISVLFLVSFNWKSVFPLLFLYDALPSWFQFCTFAFYTLYLAKTLYMIEGKQTKTKKYLDFIFAMLIIFSFAFVFLVSYFDSKYLEDEDKYKGSDILAALYLAILILPLLILFGIMGVKYYKKSHDYLLLLIQKERIKYVMLLIIIDGLIFLGFFIWSLFSAFGGNKIQKNVDDYLENKEYSKYDTFALIFGLIFFIIPAFVLFIILHRVLSNEKGMFQREENILLTDLDDDNDDNFNSEYKLFDVKK
ncbi:tobamovirus multiplication protein 1-like isoform x1 [Anaeramoeba ignava]|uniref:Tobamovirus multiplication protein 1-like isoform x1 n=1 Tax=Anaeramoeba ignava TaxID=1746090 RepID=A0A9Q0LLQ3_ANAIG|nr:tobamovirus multiplication protein 1-like isoform x1 [Anaeramoeba ignava]